jgi:hypothetical protein
LQTTLVEELQQSDVVVQPEASVSTQQCGLTEFGPLEQRPLQQLEGLEHETPNALQLPAAWAVGALIERMIGSATPIPAPAITLFRNINRRETRGGPSASSNSRLVCSRSSASCNVSSSSPQATCSA